MRRSIPNLASRTAAIAIVLVLFGCQPEDVQPGLWLNGEVVAAHVGDWTFTDEIDEVFIETQTWYLVPHSTTIWCATLDGVLYIGSYGDEKKRWEENVARNPNARLRILDELYDVTISAVSDLPTVDSLNMRYSDKYDMQEVFGEDLPVWWYYRITQRD